MEEVLNCLNIFLGKDNDLRAQVQERLTSLESVKGYASILLEIVLNQEIDLRYRQLAGVFLKTYVLHHWNPSLENFKEPVADPEEKAFIRNRIVQLLTDEEKKIRTIAALVISTIAQFDWPDEWPNLIENLVESLKQKEDINLVHGSLRCLEMFASGDNFSDYHLPLLYDHIFPVLLNIFKDETAPEKFRLVVIRILYSIFNWLAVLKDYTPKSKSVISSTLASWFEYFMSELNKPDSPEKAQPIKIYIIQILLICMDTFPEYFKEALPMLVPSLWTSFVNSTDIWVNRSVINSADEESGYDSDTGDYYNYKYYLCALISLFKVILDHKRFKYIFQDGVIDLCYYCTKLMQLTEGQVEDYTYDPSQYLMDEDTEGFGYSVRLEAHILLTVIIKVYFPDSISFLQKAVVSLLDEYKESNNWKLLEAIFFSVGNGINQWHKVSGSEEGGIVDEIEFDIRGFIKIISECLNTDNPILVGRLLWCSGKLLPLVHDQENFPTIFIERAADVIRKDVPLPTKIYACKCVTSHVYNIKNETINDISVSIIPYVCEQAQHFNEESLYELLEVIEDWIKMVPKVFFENYKILLDIFWNTWGNNVHDPYIAQVITDCIKTIAKIENTSEILQSYFGPRILDIFIKQSGKTPTDDNLVVLAGMIEALNPIVGYATWPLSYVIMDELFPRLVHEILITEDHEVMQNGCGCLVSYIRCARENLATWHSGNNVTGIQLIVKVIEHILNPELEDGACLYAGPVISKLLDTVGNHLPGEQIGCILKLVFTRLQSATLPSLKQSLLMIFIKLIISNSDQALDFLSNIHSSSGENGLMNFLSKWAIAHEDFHGSYQTKISLIGLMKLFTIPSLDNIFVPGDLKLVEGKLTRSQKKKIDSREPVPLKPRIFTLIVRAHISEIEDILPVSEENSEEDDDDVFFQDIEEGKELFESLKDAGESLDYLDGLIDQGYDDDDLEIDPDIKNDEIYNIEMESYLRQWILDFKANNPEGFNMCVQYLTKLEVDHLNQYVFRNV